MTKFRHFRPWVLPIRSAVGALGRICPLLEPGLERVEGRRLEFAAPSGWFINSFSIEAARVMPCSMLVIGLSVA